MLNDFFAALPWPLGQKAKKRELRTAIVARTPHMLQASENPEDFEALDTESGSIPKVIGWQEKWWWFDPDDMTTDSDLTVVFRTLDGFCYKVNGTDYRVVSVRDRDLLAPPTTGFDYGDALLVPDAATGDFAGWDRSIAILTARGWQQIAPRIGTWLHVEDEDLYVRYTAAGAWEEGPGARSFGDLSIPLSAIINAGRFVLVENQTQNASPGARRTGATPTMPLGGTAANINDDNTATVGTSGALGDLTGLPDGARIIARLELAAVSDLIAIEGKGLSCSTGSSSATACGLYYSDDSGATWTLAGAGFTLTTVATDVLRTGSFPGVTDIAFITEGKNWAAATHSIQDLNAYDPTVTGSPPTAYIIGPNPIGIFAGNSGKVAVFEAEDEITIYNPPEGMLAYDKALHGLHRRDELGEWVSSTGAWTLNIQSFTANDTYAPTDRIFGALVWGVASGGTGTSDSAGSPVAGIAGGSVSFGAHLSATGGAGASTSAGGAGGVGSGGVNFTGQTGAAINASAAGSPGGESGAPFGNRGHGGPATFAGGGGGGGGGSAIKWIDADDLGGSEVVTIGTAGMNNGQIVVFEFLEH